MFVVAATVHFIVDFLFQTHETAVNKKQNNSVLFRHCSWYAVWVSLAFSAALFKFGNLYYTVGVAAVFGALLISHYYIDNGFLMILWAKYIHKNPRFEGVKSMDEGNKALFEDCLENPFRPTIYIAVDQIMHISVIAIISLVIWGIANV